MTSQSDLTAPHLKPIITSTIHSDWYPNKSWSTENTFAVAPWQWIIFIIQIRFARRRAVTPTNNTNQTSIPLGLWVSQLFLNRIGANLIRWWWAFLLFSSSLLCFLLLLVYLCSYFSVVHTNKLYATATRSCYYLIRRRSTRYSAINTIFRCHSLSLSFFL